MISRLRTLACLVMLSITSGHATAFDQKAQFQGDFEHRRSRLLEMLTAKTSYEGDIDSGDYGYRRRWQYYNACLARGIRLEQANRYFAESKEVQAEEWHVLLYLRTYFAFKDTVLREPARKRLEKIILDYKHNAPRSKSVEQFGTNGNHSIVAFSQYLLTDQQFGRGDKHKLVREKFITWVQHQGRFGRDEVNSPHYLERSLLPLLNLYDFIDDATLKTWAHMAIDQLIAEFAVLSLGNVRGGPWCRAHQNHTPGLQEINNGKQDSFYVVGYQFWGRSPMPAYELNDQILSYGFVTTTNYRPPGVIIDIAESSGRTPYEFKSHRRSVNSKPSPGPVDWDMYYYITPSFSLAALQDKVTLDNHVTGRLTRDFKNTQVWELSFADPMKILGPKRDLRVSTGENRQYIEEHNPNTAMMQYKNVLFYKGQFMDYNRNMDLPGTVFQTQSTPDLEYYFWQIPTTEGAVYVGITHFAQVPAGILEVVSAKDGQGIQAFKEQIMKAHSTCHAGGEKISYTSTRGDQILYDKGKVTVNEQSWPLHGYPLYESLYLNSAWGSGVITITKDNRSLLLDFRDRDKPIRHDACQCYK
jgi:hypothetical protein